MRWITGIFMTVLNMSITGAIVIAVVIILRLLLRRFPKRISYLLWLLVLFRLVCPVSFTADFSLLSTLPVKTDGGAVTYVAPAADAASETDAVEAETGGTQVAPQQGHAAEAVAVNHTAAPLRAENIATTIWLLGMAGFLAYGVISYLRLKRRLTTAVRVEPGVLETERIAAPFVLGVLKPRIYLPSGLAGGEREYVLFHERVHIQRRDALAKLVAFIVWGVHWFNPLVWVAFLLMSRDMEQSCDERVIREAGFDRRDYSRALLRFAAPGTRLSASPISFGESGVKQRICNILRGRKPAFWAVLAAVAVCVAAGVICLANPAIWSEDEAYAARLYACRTPYIGDNAAVSALLDELKLPEGIYVESFQLDTSHPPYQLTIHYRYLGETPAEHSDLEAEYFKSSALLFSTIDNAGVIRHVGHWSDPELTANYFDYTHTREAAEAYLGVKLEAYGQSGQKLAELMRLLSEKTNPYVEESPASNASAPPVQQAAYAQVYAMGDTIFADLNGDGKEEEIYYGTDGLRINGVSFKADLAEVEQGIPSTDIFLVTDIDASDKQRELALRCDGPTQDPQTFFYTWEPDRLIALGSVPCHTDDLNAAFDGRGTILGTMRLSVLQTWWADAQWALADGKISPLPQMVYTTDCPATLKEPLPVYARPGDAEPAATLSPQAVTLTATDNEAWCEVRGADGTGGWFRVQDYDWLPDINMSADEAFDGLSAAD